MLQEICGQSGGSSDYQDRQNAADPPQHVAIVVAVEAAIEDADEAADPSHRMADDSDQPLWITESELDQHGEKGKRDEHGVL